MSSARARLSLLYQRSLTASDTSSSLTRANSERRRSNTNIGQINVHHDNEDLDKSGYNASSVSRRSILDPKDANALTAQMLSAASDKQKRAASPCPSNKTGSTDRSSIASRRRSAPVSIASATVSEDGVLVKRRSGHPIDEMTAALLAGVAGAKVPASSLGTNRRSLQVLQQQQQQQEVRDQLSQLKQYPNTPESSSTSSSTRRRRPNLSIDISRNDSNAMRCDDHVPPIPAAAVEIQPTASVKVEDPNLGKGHLRRRSWKSVSGATLPSSSAAAIGNGEDNMLVPGRVVDDQHVTKRKVTPKLSPPKESAEDEARAYEQEEEQEEEPQTPAAPRSSLDEEQYDASQLDEENVEVSICCHAITLCIY